MWRCAKCGEKHADHFSSCWKCAGMEAPPPAVNVAPVVAMACQQCETPLSLLGNTDLKGAQAGGFAGFLGKLLPDRDRLEIYHCPRCGRLDLFSASASAPPRKDAPVQVTTPGYTAATPVQSLLNDAKRLELQEELGAAVGRYQEVMNRYPGTAYAREAETTIFKIKTKLGI